MPEVIPIGSDHAGFELKERLVEELRSLGYEPLDLGTDSAGIHRLSGFLPTRSRHASSGTMRERGVLLCGTGLGMSYAANRHPGVRAAVAWTPEVARLAREHNDANVLILPARFVSEDEGVAILKTWLADGIRGRPPQPASRQNRQEHG